MIRRLDWKDWAGLALLIVGLAAWAFLNWYPGSSAFQYGLLYTTWRYDQALPLIGLGIVLAQLEKRPVIMSCVLFCVVIPFGGFISSWVSAALTDNPGIYRYLYALPPAIGAVTGVALVAPDRARPWLAPPAAIVSGVQLGMVLNFDDPNRAEWLFAAGAILSGFWLVGTPLILWRRFAPPWFRIPGRIFGSWLIAIGAMLVALHFIPRG